MQDGISETHLVELTKITTILLLKSIHPLYQSFHSQLSEKQCDARTVVLKVWFPDQPHQLIWELVRKANAGTLFTPAE